MESKHTQSNKIIRVPLQEMEERFMAILIRHGFNEERARLCSQIFTQNSVDGIYTHGVNRFPKFIEYVSRGYIHVDKGITQVSGSGSVEQWNGNLGPGPLNAIAATERVMEIAANFGIGCLALGNTNHWMRGGYYGWQAAKAGYVFIGWSNTIANMPAWGATDSRLGNNPFVIAVPYQNEAIVLDMAMSQYSYGALELHKIKNQQLAVPGGYDSGGNLTKEPDKILESHRVLPIGYWKGAGLSLLLDVVATILTAGNATYEITRNGPEAAVSQVFMAIALSKLGNYQGIASTISGIINDYHSSMPENEGGRVLFPGERVLITRKQNNDSGVPVDREIWDKIRAL